MCYLSPKPPFCKGGLFLPTSLMAINGIRATPLMAYNGSAIRDCLMTGRLFLFFAIKCHSATNGSDCHSLPLNAIYFADFFGQQNKRRSIDLLYCCGLRISHSLARSINSHSTIRTLSSKIDATPIAIVAPMANSIKTKPGILS